MKKKTISILIAMLLLLSVVIPASAITNGELDGEGHPHVVLLLMDVGGEPTYRCSGTLLSPTVLLTAGHCTSNYPDEPYSGMRIYTESDVDGGDGITNDYSNGTCDLGNCYEAVSWAAHPLYETDSFIYHDVGIVILEEPGYLLEEYGVLPELNELDDLDTGKNFGEDFTSVGYGLSPHGGLSFPDQHDWICQSFCDAAFQ